MCRRCSSTVHTGEHGVPLAPQGRRCMLYIPLATHFDFPNYLTARWVAAFLRALAEGSGTRSNGSNGSGRY